MHVRINIKHANEKRKYFSAPRQINVFTSTGKIKNIGVSIFYVTVMLKCNACS